MLLLEFLAYYRGWLLNCLFYLKLLVLLLFLLLFYLALELFTLVLLLLLILLLCSIKISIIYPFQVLPYLTSIVTNILRSIQILIRL